MRTERVVFNGRTYTRYPESKSYSLRHYFRSHAKKSVNLFLHREVWKFHNGPIPKGYHVHHKDGDTGNNDIGNLELLSYTDHMRHHHSGVCQPAKAENLARVRHLGWAWHRTKEGQTYHRKRAARWVAGQPLVKLTCKVCGSTRKVKTIGKYGSDYCSTGCRQDAGVYNETRECAGCGKTFSTYKHKPTRCCSRKCAWVARKAKR